MKKITLLAAIFFCIISSNAQGVSTFAGSGVAGYSNGTGIGAQFNNPTGVCIDASGNLYVADSDNNRIRKISQSGVVTTFAGSGIAGFANGTGTAAQFSSPNNVCIDASGNLYVADTNNNRIRKISQTGVVTTLAGSGTAGNINGTSATAQFNSPKGVCVDATGNVFVADFGSFRIRKITTSGVVTTLAGSDYGYADGTGTATLFRRPTDICVDTSGNIYVADREIHAIRKITQTGVVTTIAGAVLQQGNADGTGSNSRFSYPEGISIDALGNLYIADTFNNLVRKITPSGVVTTLAGSTQGYADGMGTAAQFARPKDVCIDMAGNVYVIDCFNYRIRKITPCNSLNSPILNITPSTATICTSQSITLTATGGASYSWSSGQNTASISVSPTQATTYTVTATNANGCSSTGAKTVNVNPLPIVVITGTNSICPGQTVTLIASGGNSYLWSNGSTSSSISVNPLVNTTYSVTGTNTYGCSSTSSKTITVNPNPIATITGNNSICPGNYTTLTASGGNSYLWNNGSTSSSITVNPSVTISYSVTATNTYGCSATAAVTVNVNPIPQVSINSSNSVCYGANITLTASGGQSYLWGNGNTTSSLTVNPLTTTTYSVTATNIYGCTATASKTITVNPLPTITISPTSPITCSGQNITLTANGGTSYVWSNGAIGSSVIVAPTTNTTYSVTGTDINGCSTNVSKAVNIYSTPLTNISADGVIATSTTINNGSSVQLQLNGSFNAVPNIQWSPATGIGSTTASNPVVYPSNTTTYTASFTNSNGCQQSTSFVVNVNPQPTIGTLSLTSTSSAAIGLFDTITVDVQLTGATNLYSLFMKLKGNAAVNQYLDYQGFTASTLLGSGSSIISTPPTVTNGVVDFGITKVGPSSGYSGSGLYYTLRFIPKNISIPNGTVFCFYIDDVSSYNSSGIQCGLNNQGQICYTFTNQVNVWPGDLNKSNSVSTADILPIGYFYNSTGSTRPNASIQWNAQPATLWGYNRSSQNGDAYKVFADSNGDGVINNADQTAIGFNMNQVHAKQANSKPFSIAPKTENNTLAAGGLVVTPNTTIVNGATLPQTITFTVNLNNTGGLNALYGISVNLIFDDTIFDLSTATIDYTGSIFGTAGSNCLVMNYNSATAVSVGLTRYANAAINGQGLLFKVTLQTKSHLGSSLTQTSVTAYVDAANNQAGDTLAIQDAPITNFTIINNLGIDDIKQDEFVLYPNPTNDILYLSIGKSIDQLENFKLVVFNTLGQIVNEMPVKNYNMQISTRNWGASGVYFIKIVDVSNSILTTKKIILK
ncbi:Secretion system C-terminal sorting domain [Flavobacteriaceae bacterium]